MAKAPSSLAEASAYQSRLHRQFAMQRYFESLPIAQYPAALQELLGENRGVDTAGLQILLRIWVAKAPADAAARVKSLTPEQGRSFVLGSFARAWARIDPIAAEAWAFALPQLDQLSVLNQVKTIAERNQPAIDPRQAFEQFVQKGKFGSPTDLTLDKIFGKWAEKSPAEAGVAALSLPHDSDRQRAVSALLYVWSRSDPRAAMRYVMSLQDETLLSHIDTYIAFSAEKDLAVVRQAAADSKDPALRRRLNRIVADQLARTDLDGAVAFLGSIPEEDRKSAQAAYQRWAESDPVKAVAAYRELFSYEGEVGKDRPAIAPQLRYVMEPWIRKDPAAAGAAILDLHKADRADLLFDIGQKWCRADASAAGAWAAALPEGAARDEALRQFTYTWSQHDSTKATAFLNALPPGSGKAAAAEGFAFSIFDTDPDAALAWTRVIGDNSQRLDVLRRAWSSWQRKNGSAAEDWLENSTDLTESERAAIKQDR